LTYPKTLSGNSKNFDKGILNNSDNASNIDSDSCNISKIDSYDMEQRFTNNEVRSNHSFGNDKHIKNPAFSKESTDKLLTKMHSNYISDSTFINDNVGKS